jgi:transcriptional regulator with XRE-family HTH domain
LDKNIDAFQYAMADCIKNLRKDQKITLEQISSGLCSESAFRHFEAKRRTISNEILTRALERLGRNTEDVQIYLGGKDYEKWHCKTQIIYYIIKEKYNISDEFLKKYGEEYHNKTALEEQFYFRMKAMIGACKGEDRQIISEDLKKALGYSVKSTELEAVVNEVLSIQEIDMLLDYYRYSDQQSFNFKVIIEYLKKKKWERTEKCKILPKAVYYYYCAKNEEKSVDEWTLQQLLDMDQILTDNFEEQRKTGYLSYLWEMLELRCTVYDVLAERIGDKDESLRKKIEMNIQWKTALEWLYEDQNRTKETKNMAIHYMTFNVENLGDIFKRRRKMLGMSVKELANETIDEKTVRRIENGEVKGQRHNLMYLLVRLGLPNQLIKEEFIAIEPEERDVFVKMRKSGSMQNFKEKSRLLQQLKKMHKCTLPYNEQVLKWYEITLLNEMAVIDDEEAGIRVKEILKKKFTWNVLTQSEQRYFNYCEIGFLKLYYMYLENRYKERTIRKELEVIEDYCKPYVNQEYGLNYMKCMLSMGMVIQTVLGNSGEFKKSKEWCEKLIEIALDNRRLFRTIDIRYSMWWNENEEKKAASNKPLPNLALLSNMLEDKASEKFFNEKLQILQGTSLR